MYKQKKQIIKFITNLKPIKEEKKIKGFFFKDYLDIDSGFGDIFLVIDHNEKEFILKVQKEKIVKRNYLLNEYNMYKHLQESTYTSNCCKYFLTTTLKCLIITKYDIDLKDLYDRDIIKFHYHYKKMIFMQMFSALEDIHKRFVIHQDIKLGNFTYNFKENKVYLIDFGASRIEPILTVPATERCKRIIGTLRYASLNSHRTMLLTPYDDIESLLYVFIEIELHRKMKKLPWRGRTKYQTMQDKWDIVYSIKRKYLIETYTRDRLPIYLNKLIRKYRDNIALMKKIKIPLKIFYQNYKMILIDNL